MAFSSLGDCRVRDLIKFVGGEGRGVTKLRGWGMDISQKSVIHF